MMAIRVGFAVASAFLFSGLSAAGDHPLHTTHATVEFNPETSSFEVSLCLFPDDLARVLSEREGRPIRLHDESNLDGMLKDLVQSTFQLRIDAGVPQHLQWLGHEFETQQAWLYFEFPLDDDSPAEVGVKNSLLLDQFDDQINVAYVRMGGRQRALSFRNDNADWLQWKIPGNQHPSVESPKKFEAIH